MPRSLPPPLQIARSRKIAVDLEPKVEDTNVVAHIVSNFFEYTWIICR